jgi:hypothetical protein
MAAANLEHAAAGVCEPVALGLNGDYVSYCCSK